MQRNSFVHKRTPPMSPLDPYRTPEMTPREHVYNLSTRNTYHNMHYRPSLYITDRSRVEHLPAQNSHHNIHSRPTPYAPETIVIGTSIDSCRPIFTRPRTARPILTAAAIFGSVLILSASISFIIKIAVIAALILAIARLNKQNNENLSTPSCTR